MTSSPPSNSSSRSRSGRSPRGLRDRLLGEHRVRFGDRLRGPHSVGVLFDADRAAYHHLAPPATAAPTTIVDETTTVEETEATEPPVSAPVVDGCCDPSVDNHATAADGTFLKCRIAGSARVHWVRSVPIIGAASEGDSCDPSVTVSPSYPKGRTSSV